MIIKSCKLKYTVHIVCVVNLKKFLKASLTTLEKNIVKKTGKALKRILQRPFIELCKGFYKDIAVELVKGKDNFVPISTQVSSLISAQQTTDITWVVIFAPL